MTMFYRGVLDNGYVKEIQIFYAKDCDEARAMMVEDYGARWMDTHVLCGVETFRITV